MSFHDRLNEALAQARRQGDDVAMATIRLVLMAIRDRERARTGSAQEATLSESEIQAILETMIDQRRQQAARYRNDNDSARADREDQEAAVLAQFLPQKLDEAATAEAVDAAIAELGAQDVTDMGRTMAHLRRHYGGRMDFSRACGLVKQRLAR